MGEFNSRQVKEQKKRRDLSEGKGIYRIAAEIIEHEEKEELGLIETTKNFFRSKCQRLMIKAEIISADYGLNLSGYNNLGMECVEEILSNKKPYEIGRNIKSFAVALHEQIAFRMVQSGQGYSVIRNLEDFQNVDKQKLAELLIEKGLLLSMLDYLEKFYDIDFSRLLDEICGKGQGLRFLWECRSDWIPTCELGKKEKFISVLIYWRRISSPLNKEQVEELVKDLKLEEYLGLVDLDEFLKK